MCANKRLTYLCSQRADRVIFIDLHANRQSIDHISRRFGKLAAIPQSKRHANGNIVLPAHTAEEKLPAHGHIHKWSH